MKKIVSGLLALVIVLGSFVTNTGLIKAELDDNMALRVQEKLDSMTLEQKVGQMLQPDKRYITPAEVKEYGIGSVLSGGGAAPGWSKNSVRDWADMINEYQSAAIEGSGIPLLYGVDAVHGHNNVGNATIFPHNSSLGQANDLELMKAIGEVTASEMRATGANWTFAPTLGVPHNERWGRTYETFSDNSEVVARLGAAFVEGLQGNLIDRDTAIGTAKHFIGEGLTSEGKNQGNVPMPYASEEFQTYLENELLPPYEAAIKSGVKSVMVSYSSIGDVKSHGDTELISGLLKGRLEFKGIVVSDFDGVDQLGGIFVPYKTKVIQGVNAGIDMMMISSFSGLQPKWKATRQAIIEGAQEGSISMERIDDAVRRILSVKFEMGLIDDPSLAYAREDLIAEFGSAEHREVARDAVRKSLTLLKNDYTSSGLPIMKELESKKQIVVAGSSANDIGRQSGGWTISWQGGVGATTQGTTIYEGIKQKIGKDGKVQFIQNGSFQDDSVEAAIVVSGEVPYAESWGDRAASDLKLPKEDIETINRIRQEHPNLPIILVVANGRPLTIANEVGQVNAIVMAGLPGSEGAGIADVLFGEEYDFNGKLSITWPMYAEDIPIKLTTPSAVLYPTGYGISKMIGTGTPPDPNGGGNVEVPSIDIEHTSGVIEAEKFSAKSYGITVSENGNYVENLTTNKVLTYKIKVPKTASYSLSIAAAAKKDQANAFEVYVDGKKVISNTMKVPSTGKWDKFKTTKLDEPIHMLEGEHTLQILAKTKDFNIDKFILKEAGEYVKEVIEVNEGKGKLIKLDAVEVTMSSADLSQNMEWYKGELPIENALSTKSSLDLRESDKTNMTTIKVSQKDKKQEILGMGISLEEATIYNMMKMEPEVRRAFINDIIDPVNGMGATVIRLTIGSADFTGREFYTYFDQPPKDMNAINWDEEFSIQKDRDYQIIQGIKEVQAAAEELGVADDLQFFASPWTPPGWMKKTSWISWIFPDNQLKLKGGILRDEHIGNLGKYFARYVEEYKKEGIPIMAVTLQNEPQLEVNYPSCSIDGVQEAKIAKAFHDEIAKSSILSEEEKDIKIWAYDFNFDGAEKFLDDLFKTPGSEYIDGVAFHPYSGSPSSMGKMQKKYPDLSMHLSERSIWGTDGAAQIVDWFRNDAQSYNSWVTMLDSDISPHQWSGTPDPTLFVQDASNPNRYWKTPEIGITSQFSKFVKPGFKRINTNNGTQKTITNVAFENPETGELVLIVVNDSEKSQDFKVVFEGAQFNVTLPSNNVATYRWNPKDKDTKDLSVLSGGNYSVRKGSVVDLMEGIEALDYDGMSNLNANVKIDKGNFNINKVGTYTVEYTLTNSLGKTLTLKREVKVIK